ncbi:hypothetical protein [Serratia ficaria]|uniref:hypothetical protein n=1 Tax=Serratia ficaria TaxID=61651 RepID=UPI0021C96694|nr:hypothetical protein [Serratia ficaria]
MIKPISIVFTAIILGGCVSAPSTEELKNANYGEMPSNYQEIIKDNMSGRLKDPYSAQYTFKKPTKGWCKSGFSTYYGWLVLTSINAKNSYGGYTGSQTYLYLINKNSARDYTASFQTGGCGNV